MTMKNGNERPLELEVTFLLNGSRRRVVVGAGETTLEFLQRDGLTGTREGCGEGDCGACTVALGDLVPGGGVVYRCVTSCLVPAPQLHGRHLITVEGVSSGGALHPVQRAIVDAHGTQCGFCTPGIVMTLFTLFISEKDPSDERILDYLTGNICRCTGYDSIMHAARLSRERHAGGEVPAFMDSAEMELLDILSVSQVPVSVRTGASGQAFHPARSLGEVFEIIKSLEGAVKFAAGGSDLVVGIKKGGARYSDLIDLSRIPELRKLEFGNKGAVIGSAVPLSDIEDHPETSMMLPALAEALGLMASRQVKSIATLGGNIGNASPVADTVPVLWAMGAELIVASSSGERRVALDSFYKGYKKIDLMPGEVIREIFIPKMAAGSAVSFEKISKRRHLDIAGANSALVVKKSADGLRIESARLVIGGCGPVVIEAVSATACMAGKEPSADLAAKAAKEAAVEIRPISDARGSADYRHALVEAMIFKHLVKMFPEAMYASAMEIDTMAEEDGDAQADI